MIASEFVSLHGMIEDSRWTFRFTSEEQEKFTFEELAASDALLPGRAPTKVSLLPGLAWQSKQDTTPT